MKSTLLSTFTALVLGLGALTPSTASAHTFHHAYRAHFAHAGCHRVFLHGRHVWVGGYHVAPYGGYVSVTPAPLSVAVEPPPAYAPSDEYPADDDGDDTGDAVVSTASTPAASVYLGGERCLVHPRVVRVYHRYGHYAHAHLVVHRYPHVAHVCRVHVHVHVRA